MRQFVLAFISLFAISAFAQTTRPTVADNLVIDDMRLQLESLRKQVEYLQQLVNDQKKQIDSLVKANAERDAQAVRDALRQMPKTSPTPKAKDEPSVRDLHSGMSEQEVRDILKGDWSLESKEDYVTPKTIIPNYKMVFVVWQKVPDDPDPRMIYRVWFTNGRMQEWADLRRR